MDEAEIVPTGIYQTKVSGRYGSVERMVVKLDSRKSERRVFYHVRRNGVASAIIYIMSLDRFARSVQKRIA